MKLLLELLTSSYDYRQIANRSYRYSWEFNDSSDNIVTVYFIKDEEEENSWEVTFRRHNTFKITGQGDAFKIFATVIKIIEEFIEQVKPDELNFSSDDVSRTSLYKTLLEKFCKQKGYTYEKIDLKTEACIFAIQLN